MPAHCCCHLPLACQETKKLAFSPSMDQLTNYDDVDPQGKAKGSYQVLPR